MLPENLILPIEPLQPQDRVLEVSDRFAKSEELKNVLSLPVVRNGKPIGVVSRHRLDALMLTRYGRELHGNKTMLEIMNLNPIIVDIRQNLMDASQQISERISGPISEDFVVVEGENYRGIGFVIDVLRAMENDLRERTTELHIASKAKSQFLANMSHEIRTPMNGMVGMLELLQDTALDPAQRDYLQTLESSCQQLVAIINDVLDYSKFEAGKLSLECVPIRVPELVQECMDMVNASASKKQLELCSYIAPDVPLHVLGDPLRLKQVIINLLNNAIKFTERGLVAIHVLNDHFQPALDTPRLRFEVVDTGIGIAEHKVAQLFNEFAQADRHTSREYGGTGLGLAICKRIVDLHEGEIGVDSEEGQGSLFWFSAQFLSHPDDSRFHTDFSGFPGVVEVHLDGELKHYVQRQLEVMAVPFNTHSYHQSMAENIDPMREIRVHLIDSDAKLLALRTEHSKQSLRSARHRGRRTIHYLFLTNTPHCYPELEKDSQVTLLKKPASPCRLVNTLLRLQEASPRDQQPGSVRQPVTGIAIEQRSGFEHLNVLVAEDNPVNQKVIQAYLKKLGIESDLAVNGREALNRFMENTTYDVVLLDCEMPVMDGWTAARAIGDFCSDEQLPCPVLLACSAHALTPEKEHAALAGMDAYLPKPLRLNQLIRVLDQQGLRLRDREVSSALF